MTGATASFDCLGGPACDCYWFAVGEVCIFTILVPLLIAICCIAGCCYCCRNESNTTNTIVMPPSHVTGPAAAPHTVYVAMPSASPQGRRKHRGRRTTYNQDPPNATLIQ